MTFNLIRKRTPAQSPDSTTTREFVLSDSSVDHYGDVIEPSAWDLSVFKTNPIALFNHDPDFPIGKWKDIRVIGNQLRAFFEPPPLGISTRIDEILKLIDAGVLRATSVGFLPVASEPFGKGMRYLRAVLKETSIVSLPANANAVAIEAKKLGISDSTIRIVNSQPKNASMAERQEHAAAQLEETRRAARTARARAEELIRRSDRMKREWEREEYLKTTEGVYQAEVEKFERLNGAKIRNMSIDFAHAHLDPSGPTPEEQIRDQINRAFNELNSNLNLDYWRK